MITQKIYSGDFQSEEERSDLIKESIARWN